MMSSLGRLGPLHYELLMKHIVEDPANANYDDSDHPKNDTLLEKICDTFKISENCAAAVWYISDRDRGKPEYVTRLLNIGRTEQRMTHKNQNYEPFDWWSVFRGDELDFVARFEQLYCGS
jgi:hypothetical protein